MTESTIRVGARIEWFERIDRSGQAEGYAGAAVHEDAFEAIAVPREGESLSLTGLVGTKLAGLVQPWAGGPFARIHRVEHYWSPVPTDGRLRSTEHVTTPGVIVVLRAVTLDDASITRLNTELRARGWALMAGGEDGRNAQPPFWPELAEAPKHPEEP